MHILVTGGTGFVGSHLIRELLAEKKHRVHALVRDSGKLKTFEFHDDISVVHGDLFASEPLPPATEVVFHLAAVTKAVSPREFIRVNQEGTRSLLERLRPLPALRKVLLLSSLAAAGPNRQVTRLREEMPADPISLYGKSKLAQEKILAAHCAAPHVVVRAPVVFGPGDMDMLEALRIVRRGILPVLGRKEHWYSVVYVKDLVRGMAAAAFSPCQDEIFYIANPEPIEWRTFMGLAARLLGKEKTKRIMIPRILGRVLAEFSETRIRTFGKKAIFNRDKFIEMKYPAWVCSSEKIAARLHFQPRFTLEAALEETIGWYCQQGLL
ncbi:MAG: NAD-dependent epimerase/dehydratase family protein [Candidatus Aminicenantes bacterium]|nr:NAD-dependent epimerase/dehydratase family protein [Candidatus Aminicenantes bacterium]